MDNEKLEKLIERLGSKAEAARKLGVTWPTIQNWITGKSRPSNPTIQLIDRILEEKK